MSSELERVEESLEDLRESLEEARRQPARVRTALQVAGRAGQVVEAWAALRTALPEHGEGEA